MSYLITNTYMTNIKTVQRNGKGSLTALTANTSMLDVPVMTQIAQADNMYSENLVVSGNGLAYSEQMEDMARGPCASGNGLAIIGQYEDMARGPCASWNGLAYNMVDTSMNI